MADILLSVVTLLKNSWTAGNTANRTPTIDEIFDKKRIDLRTADHVLVYEISDNEIDNSSGGGSKENTIVVAIRIETGLTRVQQALMQTELKRILRSVEKDAFSDGVYCVNNITDDQDASDKFRKIYGRLMKWELKNLNLTF